MRAKEAQELTRQARKFDFQCLVEEYRLNRKAQKEKKKQIKDFLPTIISCINGLISDDAIDGYADIRITGKDVELSQILCKPLRALPYLDCLFTTDPETWNRIALPMLVTHYRKQGFFAAALKTRQYDGSQEKALYLNWQKIRPMRWIQYLETRKRYKEWIS